MKKFFQKLGFQKMDEMQKLIALKAQRNALAYVVVFLLVWSLSNSLRTVRENVRLDNTPSFLLTTVALVLMASQFYYQHKILTGTGEEKELTRSFLRTFLPWLFLLLLILAVGTRLLLA